MKNVLYVAMLFVLLVPSVSFAGLKAPDVMDDETINMDEGFGKYKTIAVRKFSIDDVDFENVDEEEEPKLKRNLKGYQKDLAKFTADDLANLGFKTRVIGENEDPGNADVVLEGKFTMIDLGSAVARIMWGMGAGQAGIGVEAKFVDVKTGKTLAEIEHENTSGLGDGDKWWLIQNEVQDMADKFAEFVKDLK